MKRIFLLRHPHVRAAEEGICYGVTDIPLSPQGEQQAQKMAEFLSRYPLQAVFASDLPRAARPAELVARQQGISLQLAPGLREIDCGEWEGLTYDAIRERYPGQYRQWLSLDEQFCFPRGESFENFRRRVWQGFEQIVQDHSSERTEGETNLAIVTHGGVTRAILLEFLQLPLKSTWRLGQDFAALNIIEYYQDYAILKLMNDTAYLNE